MKTTFRFLVMILIVIAISVGCKTKQITKVNKQQEIGLPFANSKYKTTKKSFRCLSHGTDENLMIAEELAKSNARTDITYQVKVVVQNVTDVYLNKTNEDGSLKFERLSRQISEEIITNIKVIDKKIYQNDKGFTYWIIMEVDKDDVVDISYDKFQEVDIDKHQYEKIFNEALEHLQTLDEE